MARTDNLTNFLTDVATAIKTKKDDDTPILASEFDTEITNLPSGGSGELPIITNCNYLFFHGIRIDQLEDFAPHLKPTKINNLMPDLTTYFTSITTLDLSNIDFSEVVEMSFAFQNNSKLIYINVGDLGKAGSMTATSYVFYGCTALVTIDGIINLQYPISGNTNTTKEFGKCTALETVYIKGLNKSLDLSDSTNLSVESINYLLENINAPASASQTLTLGETNLAKADTTLLENARALGWEIA